MRAATDSSGSFQRPVNTTTAPAPPKASAAASPIPLPAPVTHATLPFKFAVATLALRFAPGAARSIAVPAANATGLARIRCWRVAFDARPARAYFFAARSLKSTPPLAFASRDDSRS